MSSSIPDPLKTKKHFLVLDGMRGVAALAIVVFHFMEIAYSDLTKNFMAHGFLAVDFFFCLSGFVIAYAYDDRIRGIGLAEFFKARLIRLHPMIIFGSVLGLLTFLLDPIAVYQQLYDAGQIAVFFLCSLFLIPYPMMEERYYNLFSLNAPTWSLFWEYVANIFYAVLLYKVSRNILLFMTIVSALLICYVSYRTGNLLGGWNGDSFWDGGIRVSYSFLTGMLIYRSKLIIKNNLGFIGLAIMLTLAFISPYSHFNWLTEPFIVLFYFPLMVSLGAGAEVRPELKNFCQLAGNLSYPLYMTHYAVMFMFLNYFATYKPGASEVSILIIGGTILLVGFAYLVMIFYDIPLRRFLTGIAKRDTSASGRRRDL